VFEIRTFRADQVRLPRNFVEPSFAPGVPLDLEIGCGVGWHPIQYVQKNPARHLIAIEHTRNRFASFERRARSHAEIKNLTPVHADAIEWVTHALAPESVDRIFLLYPNPYPKRSDLNKRWHAMPFMGRLLGVLKMGGLRVSEQGLADGDSSPA
jgi:tRNA G46 methylase TrmB